MLIEPVGIASEAHDGAFPELFFDLDDGQLHGFHAFTVLAVVAVEVFFDELWHVLALLK